MTATKWTTTREVYEMRVYGSDVEELSASIGEFLDEAQAWGSTPSWKVDGDSIVLSFPETENSVGGWK